MGASAEEISEPERELGGRQWGGGGGGGSVEQGGDEDAGEGGQPLAQARHARMACGVHRLDCGACTCIL